MLNIIKKYLKEFWDLVLMKKPDPEKIKTDNFTEKESKVFNRNSYGDKEAINKMSRLMFLYENAFLMDEFLEIKQIEEFLSIGRSRFILLEEIYENHDVVIELRLFYFNKVISNKIIAVFVNTNDLQQRMAYYKKAISPMFPVKVIKKNQKDMYQFKSFEELKEYDIEVNNSILV